MFTTSRAFILPRYVRELPLVLLFGVSMTVVMLAFFLLPPRFAVVGAAGLLFLGAFVFVENKPLACVGFLAFAVTISVSKRLFIFPGAGDRTDAVLIELTDLFLALGVFSWFLSFKKKSPTQPSLITPFTVAALLYLAVCSLSLFISDYPVWTFCELVRMLKVLVLFWFVIRAVESPKDVEWVFAMLGLVVLFQGAIVLLEKYSNGEVLGLIYSGQLSEGTISAAGTEAVYRMSGTFGHPNRLAYFADLMLPLFFCLGFSPEITRKRRLFYFTCCSVAGMCLFFSYSRGGWLASSLALGVCAAFLFWRHWQQRRFMGLWLFLVMLGLAGIGTVAGKIYNRLTKQDAGSIQSRLEQYQVTENIIENNPFLGVGINNFVNVAPRYDDTPAHITRTFQEPVHNIYLLAWAESGLIGLAVFAVFVISIFWMSLFWKHAAAPFSLWGQGLFFGFLAYFVHALVDMNRVGSYALLFFLMALVVVIKGLAHER